ncbi:hypothetical protein ANMWB30_09480 [Arthrobacter sp. MWB30]|nr:hypothetical protein ANMWB30_09480 [Arthrobacter sp. MWB30]
MAAFGDSLMWGQGNNRNDRFSIRFTNLVSAQLGQPAALVFDASRSGAKIEELAGERDRFADLYPFLFPDANKRKAFLKGETDEPAHGLYGEVPSTFPTVLGQVKMLTATAGRDIDVALVTGGINDVDVVEVINPMVSSGRYMERYDGYIRRIVEDNVVKLLRSVRAKCPNAVILYFGFFPGFSYSSDVGKMRELFKHEFNDDFKWWLNRYIYEKVDVNKMINEAQTRALWFNGRWQYWTRRAVNLMNSDVALRTRGVLFVPSHYNSTNAGFAPNSELWEDYKYPTGDPASGDRYRLIPRRGHLVDMRSLAKLIALGPIAGDQAAKPAAQALEAAIDGPGTLKGNLTDFVAGQDGSREAVLESLANEIHLIQHGLIASLAHPNARGTLTYATKAVERYLDHLDTNKKVAAESGGGTQAVAARGPGGGNPPPLPVPGKPLNDLLERCNLRGSGALAANVTHLNVDSLALIVKTAPNSSRNLGMSASLALQMQAGHAQRSYLLTFVNFVDPIDVKLRGADPIGKPYPYLEPGAINRFTVVATEDQFQLKLEDIVSSSLVLGPDPYPRETADIRSRYGTRWEPDEVTLEVNGIPVKTVQLFGQTFGPNDHVDLQWPAPDATFKPEKVIRPRVKRVKKLTKAELQPLTPGIPITKRL